MKWMWRIAAALVACLALAVGAFFAIPTERIARVVTERLEEATGRRLTIDGALKARLLPRPGIVAQSVRLSNAPWSGQGPMLVAERMEVAIAPGSLFSGPLHIRELDLTGAAITLERRPDGIGNWDLSVISPEPTGPAAPGPSIDTIRLAGAEIAWIDHNADAALRLRAVDLETTLPTASRPASLNGSALLGSRAVKLAGRVDDPVALLEGGLEAVTLSLSSGGTAITLDGRADLKPLAFDGTVDLRSDDGFALFRDMGLEVPDFPRGLGRNRVALTAGATFVPQGSLHLRGMDLALDANRLSGDLDVFPGEARPKLVATIGAPILNLDSLSRRGQGGESALVTETGWARAPLVLDWLGTFDLELAMATGPISLGDADLDAGVFGLALERGRLVVTIDELRGYAGTIGGQVVLNTRNGISMSTELDGTGLAFAALLDGFAGAGPVDGDLDATLKLTSEGASPYDLVRAMQGEATLALSDGAIRGVDLTALVREAQGTAVRGTVTPVGGALARITVSEGRWTAREVRLDSEVYSFNATGYLDLGLRHVDLRLMPRGDAQVPVMVRGRLNAPRVQVDRAWMQARAREAEQARRAAEAARRAREEAARLAREQAERRARLAQDLGADAEASAAQEALNERVEQELRALITGAEPVSGNE